MEYECWKDLPLHEDVEIVQKPEAVARVWPTRKGVEQGDCGEADGRLEGLQKRGETPSELRALGCIARSPVEEEEDR